MKSYISYSEINLWYRDKKKYVDQYINGNYQEPNEAQKLGIIIHKALEKPTFEWQKELVQNGWRNKLRVVEKILLKMRTKILPEHEATIFGQTKEGDKIMIVLDGLDRKNRIIQDFKTYTPTGTGYEKWTQYIVNEHKQMSFYAWVWYLTYHEFLREIEIDAIDATKGNVKVFKTARGWKDIQFIEGWALTAIGQIKNSGLWEKRLSTKERTKEQTQLKLLDTTTLKI